MFNALPLLAQAAEPASSNNDAAAAGAFIVVIVATLVGLAIGIGLYVICALVQSKAIKSLPESARKCNPIFPWLVIIPLAGIVFQILCFLQIPASFLAHFGADDAESKSAKTLGTVALVALCCCIVPLVNFLAGPVYLVCMILFLVKIHALGKRALATA